MNERVSAAADKKKIKLSKFSIVQLFLSPALCLDKLALIRNEGAAVH